MRGLVVDLFAGGGGASIGLEVALGRPVDIALNHDRIALEAHKANHPHTAHLEADVWSVDPLDATGGRPVDVLWASPDCTHFSVAKGGKPVEKKIRSLANAVVRWAAATHPPEIYVENVYEFQGWGPLHRRGQRKGKPIKARAGDAGARGRTVKLLPLLALCAGCASLDPTFYVDERFAESEEEEIRQAAATWETATGGALHVDLVFGQHLMPTRAGAKGKRMIARFTPDEVAGSEFDALRDDGTVAYDLGGEEYEIIAVVPEWNSVSLRMLVAHELGHHFGMHHIANAPRALMASPPAADADRFVTGGCISRPDIVELRNHVNLDGLTVRMCL